MLKHVTAQRNKQFNPLFRSHIVKKEDAQDFGHLFFYAEKKWLSERHKLRFYKAFFLFPPFTQKQYLGLTRCRILLSFRHK